MKKIKKFLGYALCILLCGVVLIGMFTPVVYWFMHTDLTYMQVFLKMWWVILITLISAFALMVKLNAT